MAQLKNTTINDSGNLKIPVGTTAQRPSPSAGQFRYNTTTNNVEIYTGGANAWLSATTRGVRATGGIVYDVDVEGTTYRVHVFTTIGNSTFTVSRSGAVEYLVVAGGGGGGEGGGGAGGLIIGTTTVTPQAYTITVGSGGTGSTNGANIGTNGNTSSAFGLTSIGGGYGGVTTIGAGAPGGSGGGGRRDGGGAGGSGTSGQGNAGGNSQPAGPWKGGGGGGSAGSVGGAGLSNGTSTGEIGGRGGDGIQSIISGIPVFYAGGGGGCTEGTGGFGAAGLGGGGRGYSNSDAIQAVSGTANTGGGGGGRPATSGSGTAGNGGSGTVIIRYPLQSEPDVAQPKVTGDGLVLDLDFSKPTVYVGAGTTVNDGRLNTVARLITLVNSPAFTDARTHRSSFLFTGSQTINIEFNPLTLTQTTLTQEWTVSAWINIDTTTGQLLLNINNGLYPVYGAGNSLMYLNAGANDYYTYGGNFGGEGWRMITFRFKNSTGERTIWKNDSNVSTGGPNNTSTPSGISTSLTIGNNLRGRLATFWMYNRYISDSEVINIFNSTRWRFGV